MNGIRKLLSDANGSFKNTLKVFNIKPVDVSNFKQALVHKVENIKVFNIKPVEVSNFKQALVNKVENISNTHAGAALNSKVIEVISWYDKVSGMDEVRDAQNKVLDAEMQFVNAQAQRREAHKELVSMQRSLKDLREEVDTTTRGERRYILLVTKEHELLQEEQKLMENFNHCEEREREAFTILSCSLKDSHEKERAQALRTKYWSLIASVMGTLIGLVASTINGHARMRDIKRLLIDLKQSIGQPPPPTEYSLIDTLTPFFKNSITESEQKVKQVTDSYYERTKNILFVSVVAILLMSWFR